MTAYPTLSVTLIKRFLITLSLATTIVFMLVACGNASTAQAGPTPTARTTPTPSPSATLVAIAHVKIAAQGDAYAFVPATLKVKVGTQVIWTNETNAPHTVTSDMGVFNTPNNLEQNQTFTVIFTKPGTYTYYCNFHLYMKGTIIVVA
jgi:plastocyanin